MWITQQAQDRLNIEWDKMCEEMERKGLGVFNKDRPFSPKIKSLNKLK